MFWCQEPKKYDNNFVKDLCEEMCEKCDIKNEITGIFSNHCTKFKRNYSNIIWKI